MKNNVPFDVAFSLGETQRRAWAIMFGEMDGQTWDWDEMDWKTKS